MPDTHAPGFLPSPGPSTTAVGVVSNSAHPLTRNVKNEGIALRACVSVLLSWCFKPSKPQKDYITAEGVG